MSTLSKLNESDVMCSAELVDIINSVRAEEGGKAILQHYTLMEKIRAVLGEDHQNFLGVYVAKNMEKRPCYYLPRRECNLMVMSESYKIQARVYDRWQELEEEKTVVVPVDSKAKFSLSYKECLEGAEVIARLLRLPESGMLKLVQDANKSFGSPLTLPSYAVDGGGTSARVTFSLTQLLKDENISAVVFNRALVKLGYLTELSRVSGGRVVYFKSITEKGIPYGKNIISPVNPRESQPHWYSDTFKILLGIVNASL